MAPYSSWLNICCPATITLSTHMGGILEAFKTSHFFHGQLDVFWLSCPPLWHPHKSFQNLNHTKLHLYKVNCYAWLLCKKGVGGEVRCSLDLWADSMPCRSISAPDRAWESAARTWMCYSEAENALESEIPPHGLPSLASRQANKIFFGKALAKGTNTSLFW